MFLLCHVIVILSYLLVVSCYCHLILLYWEGGDFVKFRVEILF